MGEEALLVLCCLEPLSPAEVERFRSLARDPSLDWPLVQKLARLNKVEPRLTKTLRLHGVWSGVPPAIAAELDQATEAVAVANQRRLARAVELFSAFAAQGVEVCVLKGMLFAETLYRDPLYKRMNDIDMLVHTEDLPKILAIYKQLGYFPIAERVANRPDLNRKLSHHLPPFVSPGLDCLLGTQWGLKSPRAGLRIDYSAIWSRIEPQDFHGVPVHKLAGRDNLFHVCVHLGAFKSGLRDLMDIANLIRQESSRIDWPAFLADVRTAGAQSLVVHALTLVQRIDPQPQTEAVLAALTPEARGFYLTAAQKKSASLSVLVRTCSGHLSEVERAVSAFNVVRYFPEKLRLFGDFWKSVLLAPPAECQRIVFSPDPTPAGALWARFVAPGQILRAIGAEVGGGLVALLLLKSVVDLTVAALRWPFTARSENDMAAYARSLGLTLADLQRISESIY